MNKLLSFAAAAGLCFSLLAGCGAPPETEEDLVRISDRGAVLTVEPQVFKKEYRTDDQAVLLSVFSHTLPYMSSEKEESSGIAETFNQKMQQDLQKNQRQWEKLVTEEGDLQRQGTAGMEWTNIRTYQLCQLGGLLSVRFEDTTFCGGAHDFTDYSGCLFDVRSGRFIAVEDLTDGPQELETAVAEDILRQIEEGDLAIQNTYWQEYPLYVREYVHDAARSQNVMFSGEKGLEIIFPAYELASYAAGPQEFHISGDVLKPYLNDYGAELLEE